MSGFLIDTNVLSEYNRPEGPDAGVKRWLNEELEAWFAGRVLEIDRIVGARWASLLAQTYRAGRPLPAVDSLIAATALAHNLVIVTRNTRDFEGIGVTTLNPWGATRKI